MGEERTYLNTHGELAFFVEQAGAEVGEGSRRGGFIFEGGGGVQVGKTTEGATSHDVNLKQVRIIGSSCRCLHSAAVEEEEVAVERVVLGTDRGEKLSLGSVVNSASLPHLQQSFAEEGVGECPTGLSDAIQSFGVFFLEEGWVGGWFE